MARAAEADIRAVERWLRSGAMAAINSSAHLEVSVQALLGAWGGSGDEGNALDTLAEEEISLVVARLSAREVIRAAVTCRLHDGYMTVIRAAVTCRLHAGYMTVT